MLQNNPVLLGLKNQLKKENKSTDAISNSETKSVKSSKITNNSRQNFTRHSFKQTKPQSSFKLVEGRVKSSSKSYGFLETETGEDYFITPKDMHKVFAGDLIKAKIKVRQSDGSLQAEPIEIIDFQPQKVLGKINLTSQGAKIEIEKNNSIVVFDLDQAPVDISDCSWIEAEFYEHQLTNKKAFKFKFLRFIGAKDDVWINWKLALAKQGLPIESPVLQDRELSKIKDQARIFLESTKREDLTNLEFFTIDGNTTKDMDDAIFIEKVSDENSIDSSRDNLSKNQKSYWRLVVAIAEPDIFVSPNSEMDIRACEVTTSIYLPACQDVAMLPKQIREDLSSLVAQEIRPTLACEFYVSKLGELLSFRFFLAQIKSHKKLNYTQVADFLADSQTNKIENTSKIIENQLFELNEFATARIQWRKENAIYIENSQKYYFEISPSAQVLDIKPENRFKSHQMIEEAMLLANQAASRFFAENNLEAIFISHSGFAEDKISSLIKFLNTQNIETEDLDLSKICDYKKLRERIAKSEDSSYIDSYIIRYSAHIEYTKKPLPHFGLGFESYTSWSSPIRKYSDLINHRIIKGHLLSASGFFVTDEILENLQNLRKSIRMVEREVNDYLYFKFLKNSEEIFDAQIRFVTKGGLRVTLEENGANVFIPISMISSSSANISCDINLALVYKNEEILYKLGDKIKVQIAKSTKAQAASLVGKILN